MKKQEQELWAFVGQLNTQLQRLNTVLDRIVFCAECGVAVLRGHAQHVTKPRPRGEGCWPTSLSWAGNAAPSEVWQFPAPGAALTYCERHRKPYDHIDAATGKFYREQPPLREVDAKGRFVKDD